jgi:DNA-binding PucR family transcriptional regulator
LTDRLGAANRLLVPGGPSLVYGWIGLDAETILSEDLLPPGTAEGTRVAFGTGATGVDGFVRTHREAMDARRVARHSGSTGPVVVYPEISLAALASVDADRARTFVVDELGALAGPDAATRQLRETALAYLQNLASPLRTAQALDVHVNTIYNRIRRAEELLGRPIDERLAETLVALRLALLEEGDPRAASRRESPERSE